MPISSRSASWRETSVMGCMAAAGDRRSGRRLSSGVGSSSAQVFHSSQAGQRPNQRGAWWPQDWQA
jgi:hypothetical protein